MQDDLDDFKLSKRIQAKLKDKQLLKKELASGKSAQEILELSDAIMARYYGAAYKLFEHERYIDAANAFLFLVTLNPYRAEFWLGLGMATQKTGDFEAAIDAYEMAAFYQIESPVPYFYLAKCLFALHDRKSALEALDLSIEYASDSPEYTQLRAQAEAAKEILERDGHLET